MCVVACRLLPAVIVDILVLNESSLDGLDVGTHSSLEKEGDFILNCRVLSVFAL
jgi:hypothetical protein